MVLQAITVGVTPMCYPKLTGCCRICLAVICFLYEIIGTIEGLFDFSRQRVEVGPADVDGSQQKYDASAAVHPPHKEMVRCQTDIRRRGWCSTGQLPLEDREGEHHAGDEH